jgi:hypothetical protein
MTKTFTHPEIGKPIPVYVHEHVSRDGREFARVNKGVTATRCTFLAPVEWLSA